MSSEWSGPIDVAVAIAWVLLLPGLALTLYRMIRGPYAADRVVALDLASYFAVALCAVYAIDARQEYPLHPAMALALLAFVGTIVFIAFATRHARRRS